MRVYIYIYTYCIHIYIYVLHIYISYIPLKGPLPHGFLKGFVGHCGTRT